MKAGGFDLKFHHSVPYYTDCVVWRGELLIGEGHSYCSLMDNFDRKVGRKLALARAIAELDKDTRTEIWKEYMKKARYT